MDSRGTESEVDEYLWPLTGDFLSVNWQLLAEELHIRTRLNEILAHVREVHIRPRLRVLGPCPSPHAIRATTQAIIAGPDDGPLWMQTLHHPVPRALREEWAMLAERLRDADHRRLVPQPDAAD